MLLLDGQLQVETQGTAFRVNGQRDRLVLSFARASDFAGLLVAVQRGGWRIEHLKALLPWLNRLDITLEGEIDGRRFFRLGPSAKPSGVFSALGLEQLEVDGRAALGLSWPR